MQRRKFSREFKLKMARLVKDRGVAVAQAARDLDVHENVLRKWVRELQPRCGIFREPFLRIDHLQGRHTGSIPAPQGHAGTARRHE